MKDKKIITNERLNAFSGCSFMLFIYTSMIFLCGFFIEVEGLWLSAAISSFVLLALTVISFIAVDYDKREEVPDAVDSNDANNAGEGVHNLDSD